MIKNEKSQALFSEAGLAFLLSAGLSLPLIFALSLSGWWTTALLAIFFLTAALTLLSLTRRLKWLVLAGLAVWQAADMILSPGGGMAVTAIVQVAKALYLKAAGQPDALPLYAGEAAVAIPLLFAFVSYFVCSKGAGFYPALGMTLVVLMGVWFSGRQELLVFSLPALVALVVLYSRNIHEDLPAKRVLPLALAAVAVAFLLLPAGKVSVKPMEEFAENLRRTIYDYLFFTEPRDVFSLASEGYYPQGSQQLGGPATPTDHPVMTVYTTRNTLLRGVIKDEYTGRVWRDTTGGRRYLYISPRWRALRDSLLNMNLPSSSAFALSALLNAQAVTVDLASAGASTLFTPQRVKELSTQSDMVVYFNSASELFITRNLEAGDRYTVKASLLEGGDPGLNTLVDACLDTPDAEYAAVYEKYTVLPGHLEQQVFDLANRITANYQTPYDKALAIKNYLSRYYSYTLDAAAPPSNIDFVTYFLFRSKEGYCTYFASAMTVLCRMAGIPARYVEGYLAQPNSEGAAYVTGLDAHAWTEVYFSGFGWVPFDATPLSQQNNTSNQNNQSPPQESPSPTSTPEPTSVPTPTPSPAPNEPSQEPSNEPEEQSTPSPAPSEEPEPDEQTPPEPPSQKPPFPWWVLLVLAAAGAVYLRLLLTTPAYRARRSKSEKDALNAYIAGVYDLLLLDRQKPKASESPLAFASRLDGENRYPHPLTPLAEALCLSQYSRHPVQAEDVAVVKATFDALYAPKSKWKKARFRLYRAFFRRKAPLHSPS